MVKPCPMVSVRADLISRTSDTLGNVFHVLREELGVRLDSISSNGRLIQRDDANGPFEFKGVAGLATAMCAIEDLKYELDVLDLQPRKDMLNKCIREVDEGQVVGRAHIKSQLASIEIVTTDKDWLTGLGLEGDLLIARAELLQALMAHPSKPKRIARLEKRIKELELVKAERVLAARNGEAPNPEAAAEAKLADRDGCRDGLVKVTISIPGYGSVADFDLFADAGVYSALSQLGIAK